MGGGHVQRCLALADALREQGWSCAFATRAGSAETVPALKTGPHILFTLHGGEGDEPAELAGLLPSGCDLLIVDHYGRGSGFQSACRSFAARVMVIEDRPERAHDCDILLDPTPGRRSGEYGALIPGGCDFLLGPEYALLRRQFAETRPASLDRRIENDSLARVFVSIGMTDPQNLTSTVLRGIAESGLNLAIDIILGSAAPHLEAVTRLAGELGLDAHIHVDVSGMANLMGKADLAIGAAGSSSFERCCLGLPSLVVIAADNQRDLVDALIAAEVAEGLDDRGSLRPENIATALNAMAGDDVRRAALADHAAALCDGLGASRAAKRCTEKARRETAKAEGF
jgi:UDP-2,4-diacetamido-2,4,6-trideoxy-beta-L-altropyranose hydrolase